MAKNVKHTVANAMGKRLSPRNYTHAIVGKHDHLQELATARNYATARALDSWSYAQSQAQLVPGTRTHPNAPAGSYLAERVVEADDVERAQAILTKYRTEAAFIESRLVEVQERWQAAYDKDQALGFPFHVLAWSQSAGNAQKAAQQWAQRDFRGAYKEVHVEPTIRHATIEVEVQS